jgi:serine/threonine protein kinase/serine/threonine protein phosphatase PrpC
MRNTLRLSIGQASFAGLKPINQDFHGIQLPGPGDPKGTVAAVADGISSSTVSHIAAESAVKSFITDYFSTPEAWSTKRAGQRVLAAINAWLYGQTQAGLGRFNKDQGYVCTLTALILKGRSAHVFHVGDSRLYRLQHSALEQITIDHRLHISGEDSTLSRALGAQAFVDVEYHHLALSPGDLFLLTTDGVHDYWLPETIPKLIEHPDLNHVAHELAQMALSRGSPDNLTLQLIRVDGIADDSEDSPESLKDLQLLHDLKPGQLIDGYTVVRPLHNSHRSHLFLAKDTSDGTPCVLKIPSTDQAGDTDAIDRLLHEEWVARRLDHPHLMRAHPQKNPRTALYIALEYLQGQSLGQWLRDQPKPSMATIRPMLKQIAGGLQALHRLEIVHQDIRPENIMIDAEGTLKIIDFGSTRIGAHADHYGPEGEPFIPLGTEQFSAPEHILQSGTSHHSDIFSMGVLIYFMLSNQLPYGAGVARLKHLGELNKLKYVPLREHGVTVPAWFESALKKALHPYPHKRYSEISELLWDLQHPNPDFERLRAPPIVERNPILLWQVISALLLVLLLLSLTRFDR